jgi:hypothetical protein
MDESNSLIPAGAFSLDGPTLGKDELRSLADKIVERVLEGHTAADAYLATKQVEFLVEEILNRLREDAFSSFGGVLVGSVSGKYRGAEIRMSYPVKVHYSPAVAKLVEEQKNALAALKAKEIAENLTTKVSGDGVLTVTLKS